MSAVLPFILALSYATQRGDPATAQGLPRSLELAASPDPQSPAQGSTSYWPLSIEGRVEVVQSRERIIDSNNNLGLTRGDLEQSLQMTDTRDSGALRLSYSIPFDHLTRLRIFAGGGVERTGTHIRAGPDNPILGNPSGSTDTDFDFGLAPVWEVGADFRIGLGDGPLDLGVSVDDRAGGDAERDAATRESYHYDRIRGGLSLGVDAAEGVRPYVGAHYSYYRARFHLTDEASGSDVHFRVAYDVPVDIGVGVELASGPVVGTVEVDFLGTLTVLASAGVRF